MLTEFDIFDEFERLWSSYRTCSDAALRLSTPNSKDDEFIKMAIVGFSYHRTTEEWLKEHWQLAKRNLDECD